MCTALSNATLAKNSERVKRRDLDCWEGLLQSERGSEEKAIFRASKARKIGHIRSTRALNVHDDQQGGHSGAFASKKRTSQ
jgi:hypothetical protein